MYRLGICKTVSWCVLNVIRPIHSFDCEKLEIRSPSSIKSLILFQLSIRCWRSWFWFIQFDQVQHCCFTLSTRLRTISLDLFICAHSFGLSSVKNSRCWTFHKLNEYVRLRQRIRKNLISTSTSVVLMSINSFVGVPWPRFLDEKDRKHAHKVSTNVLQIICHYSMIVHIL